MCVPQTVTQLVERFDRNRAAYVSGQYNETQVRREFIDPLFESLGWDVNNTRGYAEPYKDVIHEDAIKIGGATKAPDYCFRIGGTRKFFLEAKKPAVRIHDEAPPAYQLRRYAWSAKLPLSVLTDFEELALYDTRVRPAPNDSPATARVMFLSYADYETKWDEIEGILSKDAVLKGSFDKYAESKRAKRGTAEVDAEFLKEIEAWRDALARNIALRNANISTRELNAAVQQTIDRIIFLRLCEDRGIETYGRLQQHLNGSSVYERLMKVFRDADDRYNSGLFHFRPEKGREDHDRLSPTLSIDDKVLKDILRRLYYPESPYEFSVLPADILGQVYEQFLGKVIRLTKSHQAKVEEKPEVRKAGGVYYTPTYIVDYIVKNTVGKLLEGKSPKEIQGQTTASLKTYDAHGAHEANEAHEADEAHGADEAHASRRRHPAAPLRILDPACGSGSFLINAYQFLLDWYRDQYAKQPEKYTRARNPRIYQRAHNDYALTSQERKRILLDHIYGVDIDPQAVEVTKLSLLLKVLEGENAESIGQTLNLFHERALPDLNQNIKCGNSLIAPDFYNGQQTDLFDPEEMYRINAFDWNHEFPFLKTDGGFDAVIGNPPYIRIQTMKEWAPVEVEAYKTLYQSAASGNYDIYVVFIEKGLSLLNQTGRLGFICPHKFFNAQYGMNLRQVVSQGSHLQQIVHFGDQQVFNGATTYTCLLFLTTSPSKSCSVERVNDIFAWRSSGHSRTGEVCASDITADEWFFSIGQDASLLNRLRKDRLRLGEVAHIFQGLVTGADKVFIVPENADIEYEVTRPFLLTGSLTAYFPPEASARIVFPYQIVNGKAELLSDKHIMKHYPKAWAYLLSKRNVLMDRERGKWHHEQWYAFGRSQNLTQMGASKLIIQVTAQVPTVLLDQNGLYMTGGGSGPFYGVRPADNTIDIRFLLAVMNSKVFGWIVKSFSTNLRGGYIKFSKQYIEDVPLPKMICKASDKVIETVRRMLDLHKRLQTANTDHDRTILQRQITATDQQIDQLVYELYALTKEEIAIVEGNAT